MGDGNSDSELVGMMKTFAVIGGGIVGLAVAYVLTRRNPGQPVVVLEKEKDLAVHQSGRNSGVIHSGIYYRPGSTKARLCTRGGLLLRRFCDENAIPYTECGKIIVARTASELPMLHELHRRGIANEVCRLKLLTGDEAREIEPHVVAQAALHVPTAAIVDYRQVCLALAARIKEAGGSVRTGVRVDRIVDGPGKVILETTAGPLHVDSYVACAGLHSDRVARMKKTAREDVPRFAIVPFRGEYYEVTRPTLVRGLVYPVPDPRFPFLGVHFTRMIDGRLEAGPNAVLALAREGYRKRDVNTRDVIEMISYAGFWRMASKYWRDGAEEMYRSISKRAFARALGRLVPDVTVADLRAAPAGVRAQALSPDGFLYDDFLIAQDERSLHVCNAPSPAATASLAIAEEIVERWASAGTAREGTLSS